MRPAVAFYVGGFEPIGGIEACFEDLAIGLANAPLDLSLFVWGADLPQLRKVAAAGVAVHRTPLRAGCRFHLPDWALYAAHRAKLKNVERIVFGKIPAPPILRRLLLQRRAGPPETLYIAPYRPRELWGDRVPEWIAAAIDTMIVQSPDFAADLRDMGYIGRIVELAYLPPAPAPVPATRTPVRGTCRLGFLGRFATQKNLFYLLDILAGLAGDDVELHLFGEGAHEAALRAQVAARGLPASFHGPVARAGVPAAIDSCDMFLNPSITEGQCLVALEVLSRGRPFLASAVGAVPGILGKGPFGALIPLDDLAAATATVRAAVARWRVDAWNPAAIVAAYRLAYDPEAILARYRDVFTQGFPARHGAPNHS